jgi:hypothetical protein
MSNLGTSSSNLSTYLTEISTFLTKMATPLIHTIYSMDQISDENNCQDYSKKTSLI